MPMSTPIHLAAALTLLTTTAVTAETTTLLHPLDNEPLELNYRPDQTLTPAVEQFHQTGTNPYAGDPDKVADGKKIYKKTCQACHLKDGTGRIGPNLIDEKWNYPRTNTDVGQFEIIYGGGAGAMQPFGRKLDQDDILKVMAFIDTLRAKPADDGESNLDQISAVDVPESQ